MPYEVRISAKELGQMELPDFCPRCFWVKMHLGKLPFQIFPGIFYSIDAYTKAMAEKQFNEGDGKTGWFRELGELTGIEDPPNPRTFRTVHAPSGVLLCGGPDAFFRRPDGSLVIVDYKTSKYTDNQDRLMPMYEVQLNGYAFLARAVLGRQVSGLALVYMEPVTDPDAVADADNARDDGFALGFRARVVKVTQDLGRIEDLLGRFRQLYDGDAPAGTPGCKDCVQVDRLRELVL